MAQWSGDQTAVRDLCRAAKAAEAHSYAPYSHFTVGAALVADSGRIYTGCNVENASFGATICAERTASVKAIAEGERRFCALAVSGKLETTAEAARTPISPCGICRQFLSEFADPNMPVYLVGVADTWTETTLGALLPLAFGAASL